LQYHGPAAVAAFAKENEGIAQLTAMTVQRVDRRLMGQTIPWASGCAAGDRQAGRPRRYD
jgi:hypothetical protein